MQATLTIEGVGSKEVRLVDTRSSVIETYILELKKKHLMTYYKGAVVEAKRSAKMSLVLADGTVLFDDFKEAATYGRESSQERRD